MNLNAAKLGFCACVPLFLVCSRSAQDPASLSGTVTSASAAKPVGEAMITATESASQVTYTSRTDASGHYALPTIASGTYTVKVSADGFAAKTANVTVAAGQAQTLDLALDELPSAPSLGDLGFSEQQTQSNPQLQATLARRTSMLKIHQRLGILTTIPMAAAVITGPMAKAKGKNGQTIKEPTQANLDAHIALVAPQLRSTSAPHTSPSQLRAFRAPRSTARYVGMRHWLGFTARA